VTKEIKEEAKAAPVEAVVPIVDFDIEGEEEKKREEDRLIEERRKRRQAILDRYKQSPTPSSPNTPQGN
jgi:hypothetical protein